MKKKYGFTITYEDGTSEHVTAERTDDGWVTTADPVDDVHPEDPEENNTDNRLMN
jgi:hypothetical protein